nr:hypothetical protein [Ramlibacter sp. WS9]
MNDVESFWTKCLDTGVSQGVMVSPRGFTKAALAKSAHRSIRCLRVVEAQAFNWLLARGMRMRIRRPKHTNWTFYPEVLLNPAPTDFGIQTEDGRDLKSNAFAPSVQEAFTNLTRQEHQAPGDHLHRFTFGTPGLFLLDRTTGIRHRIGHAEAVVHYEVLDKFEPFKLASYTNDTPGGLITEAAIAEMDLGSVKGKFVIVYKEGEGGQVVFVTEPKIREA